MAVSAVVAVSVVMVAKVVVVRVVLVARVTVVVWVPRISMVTKCLRDGDRFLSRAPEIT